MRRHHIVCALSVLGVLAVVFVRSCTQANVALYDITLNRYPSPKHNRPATNIRFSYRPLDGRSYVMLEAALEPHGSLRLIGRVVGPNGRGVEAASISIDTVPRRTTLSDSEGMFAFDGLLGRIYMISASNARWLAPPQPVKPAIGESLVVIRLFEGASLTVSVVDESNQPVPNALLTVFSSGIAASTDQHGRTILGPLATGWVDVDCTHVGYAAQQMRTIVGGAGTIADVRVTLHKGKEVAGHVLTSDGSAVSDARVYALSAGASLDADQAASAVTDRNGRFVISSLSAGSYSFIAVDGVHAPGRVPMREIVDSYSNIDIRVITGGAIDGVVLNADGIPVQSATVRIVSQGTRVAYDRRTMSDASGAFKVQGLAAGTYRVRAESYEGISNAAVVDIEYEGHVARLEVTLQTTGRIAGTVVDDTGAVVPETAVNALLQDGEPIVALSTTSDASGRFVMDDVPTGTYNIWAGLFDNEGQVAQGVRAMSGADGVRVKLSRRGTLKAKVVIADTGAPPDWFHVQLTGASGTTPPTPANDGTFEVSNIVPGSYVLRISGPEFADAAIEDVLISAASTNDLGTLAVKRGRMVSGVVVDDGGLPVSGATVAIAHGPYAARGAVDPRFGMRRTSSDASGNFSIVGVPNQTRYVSLAADHPLGRSVPLGIPAGVTDPPPFRIVLRRCGSLMGTVMQGGKPLVGAMIGAGEPELAFAETDDNGKFALTKIPAGEVMIRVSGVLALREFSSIVHIGAANRTEVTIEVPP
jgi:protocatechuate 3,4-dioxygenase beta subunit